MVRTTIAHTQIADSREAGSVLGRNIAAELDGSKPDALLVFASPSYDASVLLEAIDGACRPRILLGGTMASGFTSREHFSHSACTIALRAPDMRFRASIGRGLGVDRQQATEELLGGFEGMRTRADLYHSAIVLADARVDRADDFIQDLTLRTRGRYQLVGGGVAGDMMVSSSQVFFGTQTFADAAVALEILSKEKLGIGVCHDWEPAGPPMRVTECDGKRLVSLNAIPAADVMESHAKKTGQGFDPRQPLVFFLRNLIGIDLGNGFKLRMPLAVNEDGSVLCAAEIPEGATVRLMRTTKELTRNATLDAARTARMQLGDRRPSGGLFFDCITAGMRREMGCAYELRSVEYVLGTSKYAGLSTAGQIVRAEGELGGFHNSTGVVLLFPQ